MAVSPIDNFVDSFHRLAPTVAFNLFVQDVDCVIAVLDDADKFSLGKFVQMFVSHVTPFVNVCFCLLVALELLRRDWRSLTI